MGGFNKSLKTKWNNISLPVKASLAFVVCSFLQKGISTITMPIFTRLLTTDQFGYYSIFVSWIDIVSVFTTLKLAGGVFTQALIKFDRERDRFTIATAGLGTTLTIIFFIAYLPFKERINNWMGVTTLIMCCILIASWTGFIFELWSVRQRINYKYKTLVALTIITSIAKPIVSIIAIILVHSEFRAQARIISIVIVELLSYFWIFVFYLKKGKSYYDARFWRYSLSLNIPLIPHYLSRSILHQSDRIMIQSLTSYSCAGIYSLAYNLAWMLSLFTNAILNSFNPWIYHKIKNKEYKQIGKVSYAILGIVAMLGLGLISLAPELIRLFAPSDYLEAIWVIPPVTASVFFLFMYSLFADFEFYFEKTKFMTFASMTGAIFNIILNFIFIKIFGYMAAGYTTLLCYILFTVAHYIAMKKILKTQLENLTVYNVGIIIAISVVFIGVTAIIMLTYKLIIIRYSIVVISAIMIYLFRERIILVMKEIRNKR